LEDQVTEISTVAKEIERKYLLRCLPKELYCVIQSKFKTMHGWLPGEIIQERITYSGKSSKFFRVIKTGKGLERIEAQEEIDIDLFTALWPLTKDKRISKIRHLADVIYYLPNVGNKTFPIKLTWEIDDFFDRNLQLAEIEIPSADFVVVFPKWLEPYVVKEVTDDSAYLNINLATNNIGK
jgi:CYTH domain-containing protein